MRPFAFERGTDLPDATRRGAETGAGQTDARVQYIAGGTTLIDLMKLDVITPRRVVDLGPLAARHAGVEVVARGLRLGALTRMADAEEHPAVARDYPMIADALRLAASPQLRNMATLGGNVLQRTRCPYYRDVSWKACNKRAPGSGCQALASFNRNHAVLGVDESCIALYPGDFAVALAAMDAEVELTGPKRLRLIPFETLHRPPAGHPHIETTLEPGEIITAFRVPAGAWTRRSLYLKIRDRASYEFALAAAAVALDLDGEVVREARIGLGGVAYRPWRSREAEAALVGRPLTREAAEAAGEAALAGAVTHRDNAYKVELGRRTLVRALMQAKAMEV